MAKPTDEVKRRMGALWYYRRRIDSDLDRLEQLRSIAERVTPTISPTPGGAGGGREEAWAGIVDLETEILEDLKEVHGLTEEIRYYIDQLDNYQERLVMEMRYISCMKFEAIADKMNYDIRSVTRLHGSALQKIAQSWRR